MPIHWVFGLYVKFPTVDGTFWLCHGRAASRVCDRRSDGEGMGWEGILVTKRNSLDWPCMQQFNKNVVISRLREGFPNCAKSQPVCFMLHSSAHVIFMIDIPVQLTHRLSEMHQNLYWIDEQNPKSQTITAITSLVKDCNSPPESLELTQKPINWRVWKKASPSWFARDSWTSWVWWFLDDQT